MISSTNIPATAASSTINGSIESLIADTRAPRHDSDTRVRNLAIQLLAQEFEKMGQNQEGEEFTLERRVFLIETTFPTVVLALEKLLRELQRCGVGVEAEEGPHPSQKQQHEDGKSDKKKFDSLNWLAQYLYRNNPSYKNVNSLLQATTVSNASSSYSKNLTSVTTNLKQRILDIAARKEAQRVAEEMAKREAMEREALAKRIQLEERNKIFVDLLGSSFKMWVQGLRRKAPGYLYRSEIISTYEDLSNKDEIMVDPSLYQKLKRLLHAIKFPTEDPQINGSNTSLHNGSNSSLHQTSDSTTSSIPATSTLITSEKWDYDTFIKVHVGLTSIWSVNDLSTILQHLSGYVSTTIKKHYSTLIKSDLFVPKFFNVTVVQDWFELLFPLIQTLVKVENHPDSDIILKACRDFCRGKEDPRFQPIVLQDDTKKDDDAADKKSDVEKDGDDATTPPVAEEPVDEITMIAETAYRNFLQGLLGEFGPVAFLQVVNHIKQEYQVIRAALAQSAANQEAKPHKKESDVNHPIFAKWNELLISLMNENVNSGTGRFEPRKLIALMKRATSSTAADTLDPELKSVISALEAYLHMLDTVSIQELVTKGDMVASPDVILKLIQHLSSCVSLVLNEPPVTLSGNPNTSDPKDTTAVNPREGIEAKALAQIRAMTVSVSETPRHILDSFLHILTTALSQIHTPSLSVDSNRQVYGRISVMERAASRLKDTSKKLSSEESFTENAIMESFLRIVAMVSSDLEHGHDSVSKTVLGKTFSPGSMIDFQIMDSKTPCVVSLVGSPTAPTVLKEDVVFGAIASDGAGEGHASLEDAGFVGVPILDPLTKSCLGALDFFLVDKKRPLQNDNETPKTTTSLELGSHDALFLSKAAIELQSLLTRMDQQQNLIALISSARAYTQDLTKMPTRAILIHPNQLYEVKEKDPSSSMEEEKHMAEHVEAMGIRSFFSSPYLAPARHIMIDLPESETLIRQVIQDISQSKSTKDEAREAQCFIPLWSANKESLVGLVVVDMNSDSSQSMTSEVKRLADVVSHAATDAMVGDTDASSKTRTTTSLEAENIDELGRRQLVFGKLVLHYTRERIMKLDARSIAELKSYKKPPASVHRLIKGVLYLLGKRPKEVKEWNDTIQFISMDLLKKIWEYDPTAVHKKIRWKRMKKVLKLVSLKETKEDEKPNSPSECLYDWLQSALVLRQEAISIRKARPDLFDRSLLVSPPQSSDSQSILNESGTLEEEDEEEEENVDVGSQQQQQEDVIEQIGTEVITMRGDSPS